MKLKKLLAAGLVVTTLAAAVPLQPVQKLIDEVSLTASAGFESTLLTTTWSGDYTVSEDLTFNSDITVSDNTTIAIAKGKTLKVSGTISVASGKTLTLESEGTLEVIGADGENGTNGADGKDGKDGGNATAAENGSPAITGGALIINGASVIAKGGNGGNGGDGGASAKDENDNYISYCGCGSKGGSGGSGVSCDTTINDGELRADGGNGGSGGLHGKGTDREASFDWINQYVDGNVGGNAGHGVYGKLTVNGGNVIAQGGKYGLANNEMDCNGNTGCGVFGDVVLKGGTFYGNYYEFSYDAANPVMHIMIAQGHVYTDNENNLYTGEFSEIQKQQVIPGKTLSPVHAVKLADGITGGSVSASGIESNGVSYNQLGNTVKLSITPDDEQLLNSVSVVDSNNKNVEVTKNDDGTYTFDMPGSDVTVIPEFIEATYYIDANGNTQKAKAIPLDSSMTTLSAGTYVVNSDVTISGKLTINGNVTLILCDGKKMTVNNTGTNNDDYAVYCQGHSLDIYGQTKGTGTLDVQATKKTAIHFDGADNNMLGIHGGVVNAESLGESGNGINMQCNKAEDVITIDGGKVTAKGESGIHCSGGKINILGGQVTALGTGNTIDGGLSIMNAELNGVVIPGVLTLGCKNQGDFISVNNIVDYPDPNDSGEVKIAEGQTLIDEDGNTYSGAIANRSVLNGKTLMNKAKATKYVNEKGETKYAPAIPITSDMTTLDAGWYVVDENIKIECEQFKLSGDAKLIIADGKKLTVCAGANELPCIAGNYALTIYGQENSTGELCAESYGFVAGKVSIKDLNVHGGTFTAKAAGLCELEVENATITTGHIKIEAETDETFTIKDTLNFGGGDIATKSISVSNIVIPDGVTISDGTRTYSGTLSAEDKEAFLKYKIQSIIHSPKYTITKASSIQNGDITINKESATEGETVTLTAMPNEDYKLKNFTVDGKAITGNTFTMPDKTVEVGAEFIEKDAQTVAFAQATVEKTYGDAKFTNAATAQGTITYSSSDESVAAVDENGEVTIKKAGTATIKAEAANTSDYKAGSAEYTLTVNPKTMTDLTVQLSGTSYTYCKDEIKPKVYIKEFSDEEYDVSYSNNINAGTGTVTITAKDGGNYQFDEISRTFTINPKAVTITDLTAEDKDYDGNTAATINGTAVINGKITDDDLTVTSGTAAFADKNVGTGKTVTFSGFALGGTAKDNYTLSAQPASVTANITKNTNFKTVNVSSNAMCGFDGIVDLTEYVDSDCTVGTLTLTDADSIFVTSDEGKPKYDAAAKRLTFKLATGKADKTAAIALPVSCSNYNYTIVIALTAKAAAAISGNATDNPDGTKTITNGSVAFSAENTVTVGADETATLSPDAKDLRVDGKDDKGNDVSKFFSAEGIGSVEMDKSVAENNNIDAFEVKDDLSSEEVNTKKNDLKTEEHAKVSNDIQVFSADAFTISDGSKQLINGLTNSKLTLKIPLNTTLNGKGKEGLRNYIIWHKVGDELQFERGLYETLDENATEASIPVDHCSDWFIAASQDYTITVNNMSSNGSISCAKTTAKYNDEVEVTVTPNSGYRYTLSVKDADGNAIPVSNNKFTMPASNVTIKAVFAKNSSGGSSIDYEYKKIDGIGYRIHPNYVGVYEGDKDIENVVIKSEVEGLPVTTIEAGSFNSFRKIKTIKLPETLTTIEQGAFWGCTALEEIDIPESVTKIESSAFSYCQNLKMFIVRNKNCDIAMYNNTLYNDNKSSKYVYDGVIVGYVGSTAEKYANRFNYTFENIEKTIVTTASSTSTSGSTSTTTTTTTTVTLGKVNDPKIDNSGKITWSKAENAAEYKVVKVVGDKKFYGSKVPHSFYYFDNIPNEDYKLYVLAYGADGKFTSGKTLTVKVNAVGKASAPTVVKDGTVTWKAVKNAVKYRVIKIVNGVYYGGSDVTTTSYKFKSVPVSDYQVYVVSYGENGAKTIGAKTTVKADKPLGFVNDTKVSADGKVTWSKAANATSYRVVKVINGKKFYGKEVKTNSYTFEKSTYKDYQVYVIAYGTDGKLTAGKRTTVEVGDLGVVLDTKVDKNGKVSWSAVRGAVKYKVYKVVDGKKYYGITEGTSFTFLNVPTKSYKVYVVSFDKDGKYRVGTTKTVNP